MRDEHPIDRLVVALEGEASASIADVMRASAGQLAGRREWVVGPPLILDESDESGRRWLGFGLSLYTARPPWGQEIDPEVDRAHLEEAKELLGEARRISQESSVSFQVEYAGEFNGSIEFGHLDSGLTENLIGEWERGLDPAQRSE